MKLIILLVAVSTILVAASPLADRIKRIISRRKCICDIRGSMISHFEDILVAKSVPDDEKIFFKVLAKRFMTLVKVFCSKISKISIYIYAKKLLHESLVYDKNFNTKLYTSYKDSASLVETRDKIRLRYSQCVRTLK